jgi:hypothetical protein
VVVRRRPESEITKQISLARGSFRMAVVPRRWEDFSDRHVDPDEQIPVDVIAPRRPRLARSTAHLEPSGHAVPTRVAIPTAWPVVGHALLARRRHSDVVLAIAWFSLCALVIAAMAMLDGALSV